MSSKLSPNEDLGKIIACCYGDIKTTITTTATSIIAITTAAIIYWALSVSQVAKHIMYIISFFNTTGQDDRE